jgi:hypothetical protein
MKLFSSKQRHPGPSEVGVFIGAALSSHAITRCAFLVFAVTAFLTSCVTPDTRHHVIVSVPQQRMALLDNGVLLATYPVSTSKFAIGDSPGSRGTPLGELEIAEKIGGSAPSGAVLKDRRLTGEIL